ncbi:MAG: DUF5317 domain-containing protein [Anaerolineales bacterium]
MILVFPILLGIAIGWLRRGSLRNLADLPIRYAWVPLAAVAVQAGFVAFAPAGSTSAAWQRPLLLAGTYTVMLAFLFTNFRIPGTRLLFVGALLNLVVMLANGGYMPVTPEALVRSGHEGEVIARDGSLFVRGSKDIVLDAEDTRLGFLSDVVGIPEALPFSATFSLGDVFIGIGASVLISRGMRLGQGIRDRESGIPAKEAALRLRRSAAHLRRG